MIITHTNGVQKVTFTWNNEMNECAYKAQGVEDETIEQMLLLDCHEGKEFEGFNMSIKF